MLFNVTRVHSSRHSSPLRALSFDILRVSTLCSKKLQKKKFSRRGVILFILDSDVSVVERERFHSISKNEKGGGRPPPPRPAPTRPVPTKEVLVLLPSQSVPPLSRSRPGRGARTGGGCAECVGPDLAAPPHILDASKIVQILLGDGRCTTQLRAVMSLALTDGVHAASPVCNPFCEDKTQAWDAKCTWGGCNGCSECAPSAPPPSTSP